MEEATASHNDSSMALQHFKQAMESMIKNYTPLNPRDGLLCRSGGVLQNEDGRPVAQEFIRGGIVRAWVAWEAYISELLEEAFWKAIELGGTCGSAAELKAEPIRFLKENWPESDTLECLAKLNAKEDSLEDKLKDHLEKILRPMAPVFAGRLGINKVFSRLFDKEIEDIPSRILMMLPKNQGFECPFQFSDNTCASLVIREKDGIRDVLRLYYGMRCVLTHGCVEKTLKGCLREFPEKPEDLKVQGLNLKSGDPSDKVSKYLTSLYHKIVAEKKNVLIEYADLVNMRRFLKLLAIQLMCVLKLWFHTSFNVHIWVNK